MLKHYYCAPYTTRGDYVHGPLVQVGQSYVVFGNPNIANYKEGIIYLNNLSRDNGSGFIIRSFSDPKSHMGASVAE